MTHQVEGPAAMPSRDEALDDLPAGKNPENGTSAPETHPPTAERRFLLTGKNRTLVFPLSSDRRGLLNSRACPRRRLRFDGMAVHEKDGRRWAQLPSRPVLDANRELVKESDGKIKYARIMEFDDREISNRFSAAVVKAVEHYIAQQAFAP